MTTAGRVITHARWGERVVFDDDALTVRPWFCGALRVPWQAMDFVCVTPAQERVDGRWRAKRYAFQDPALIRQFEDLAAVFERTGFLALGFVVKDRREHLRALASRWQRAVWGARLRPMFGADDRPKPDEALLTVDVFTPRLSAPKDALLDLLASRLRFDLVVHDWG